MVNIANNPLAINARRASVGRVPSSVRRHAATYHLLFDALLSRGRNARGYERLAATAELAALAISSDPSFLKGAGVEALRGAWATRAREYRALAAGDDEAGDRLRQEGNRLVRLALASARFGNDLLP